MSFSCSSTGSLRGNLCVLKEFNEIILRLLVVGCLVHLYKIECLICKYNNYVTNFGNNDETLRSYYISRRAILLNCYNSENLHPVVYSAHNITFKQTYNSVT